jgi:hypothetical protein
MPTAKGKSKSKSKTVKLLERSEKKYKNEESKIEKIKSEEREKNNKLNAVNELVYDINTDLDNNFIKHFIQNKERLKIALSKSGRHSINKDKAQEFIDRQISPIRRQAAKDLIDNTHYITIKEIFNITEELILKTYKEIDLTREIYLYCGTNNKSFYFFSCISLYFIKKHKLKMPHFVADITRNFLIEIEDCPLIIVDDVSYSGSQLSHLLNDFFYAVVIEEGLPAPNIHVILASVNDQSLVRLLKVPTKMNLGEHNNFIDSPFKINYLEKYKYKTLVRILGIERYFYLNLYFNVFLAQNTNIALYLDHKIADSTSTYKNVYVYGPIVPPNYDINQVTIFLDEPVYLHYFYDSDINNELYDTFLLDNPTFVIKNPKYEGIKLTFNNNDQNYKQILNEIPYFLIDKALEIDIQDREYSLSKIKESDEITLEFCPFINSCNKSNRLKEIIKDPLVLNSQYLFFMFDLNAIQFSEYDGDYFTHSRKITKQVIRLLDSHRCPENWYKNGILQLV